MPFSAILQAVVAKHPQVRGIVFCDDEGEKVEASIGDPDLDPFDLDVAGASLAPLAIRFAHKVPVRRLRAKTKQGNLWMQTIMDGYYLVVMAHPDPRDPHLEDSLVDAAEAIRAHM
jgi:hypothetical protein